MLSRKWQIAIIAYVLFVLLTPGVVVSIPPRGCNIFEGGMKMSTALVHGLVFVAVTWFAIHLLRRYSP